MLAPQKLTLFGSIAEALRHSTLRDMYQDIRYKLVDSGPGPKSRLSIRYVIQKKQWVAIRSACSMCGSDTFAIEARIVHVDKSHHAVWCSAWEVD